MKKLLLMLSVVTAATVSGFAQIITSSKLNGGAKFSIGIDGAIPTGSAGNFYSTGVGGSVKYEVPTAQNTFFTISGGYESFYTKANLKSRASAHRIVLFR